MATTLKFRRGNKATSDAFTGSQAELFINTEENRLVVHDGSTTGGFPVTKSSELTSANTFLQANDATTLSVSQSYTDSSNTKMKSYVDVANTYNQTYTNTANTNMKSYVDAANTSMKSYVDNTVSTANTSLKSYVDNQIITTNGGRVPFTSTDQGGNFRISEGITINQNTGTISGTAFSKSLQSEVTPLIIALGGG